MVDNYKKMSSLESPDKKMKMTMVSEDLVHVHLDHHIGSSLLKQKIQFNPFILKSLVKVGSLPMDTRFRNAKLIGFCEKYGLIFSNEKDIYFVKNGQVTLELKNLCPTYDSACVELGTENDYVIFIGAYGVLKKVDMNGNSIQLNTHNLYAYSVAYDATRNRIIAHKGQTLYLREPERGEIVHSMDCPSVLCVGHDGQLFVLYDSNTIRVFYGENYSQSRILATLDGPLNQNLMHIWDDRLVFNKHLKNNSQAIIHVDTKTGNIQEFATFRDCYLYRPMGKYLIRKGDNEISIFEARGQLEHFDCIWSKEVHSLMKKLNIEIPQKCDSVMYNDVALPKSIVWFLNMNCGITNCLEYCGKIPEEYEDEEMDSGDARNEFRHVFCFNPVLKLGTGMELDTPGFMDEWMENNNDGIILGRPIESMDTGNCYIATKTSECIGEEFPLYLIKSNHEIETCSLFEFLFRSKPILATLVTVDSCVTCEHAYERGVFEFDYVTCIPKLKDKNIICDGRIDTKSLLSAYQKSKPSSLHRLSTIPEEILEGNIEFEGHKYPCRDLIVLAFKHAFFTTNFYAKED